MCFPTGEFLTGSSDLLLGWIEGSPSTSTNAFTTPGTQAS